MNGLVLVTLAGLQAALITALIVRAIRRRDRPPP